jgi:ABC-type nitrate/sulfonate/bicarbonate transport system permease component
MLIPPIAIFPITLIIFTIVEASIIKPIHYFFSLIISIIINSLKFF